MPLPVAIVTLGAAMLADLAHRGPHEWPATWGLTDRQLWQIVEDGGDPLAGMSLEHAVKLDPRRIDAAVWQKILSPIKAILGPLGGDDPMARELRMLVYLGLADAQRSSSGGQRPTSVIVAFTEQAWQSQLQPAQAAVATWPAEVWQDLADRWPEIQAGFQSGLQLAEQAAILARRVRPSDNPEWSAYGEILEDVQRRYAAFIARMAGRGPRGYLDVRPSLPVPGE